MLSESLERHLLGYFTAQRLLTRIPVPKAFNYTNQSDRKIARAVVYYPVVGLVLGLIAIIFAYLFSSASPWIVAILLITISIVLTGALHLKALSQTVDAWVEGNGDRDTIFSVMRNTHASTIGIIAIVLVILLKTIALMVLLAADTWLILFFAPIYARLAAAALIYLLPAAKSEGLSFRIKQNFPMDELAFFMIITSIILFLFSPIYFISAGLTFLVIKQLTVKLLDGFTGETQGTAIELMETSSLVVAALMISQ